MYKSYFLNIKCQCFLETHNIMIREGNKHKFKVNPLIGFRRIKSKV